MDNSLPGPPDTIRAAHASRRLMRKRHGRHAVVIGASIGGVLAARALSEHFERVTLLERDRFPAAGEQRKGVPQGRHAHGLLAGGLRALEKLFPGLERELLEAGALQGDIVGDMRWHQHGGYKAKFASGLGGLLASRPLIEAAVRKRLLAASNVRAVEACRVLGLLSSPDRRRVTGVRVALQGAGEAEVRADLVVDAGGRGSRSPAWLEALGYGRPREETIKVGIGYTTRIYLRTPDQLGGDVGIIVSPKPPKETRLAAMLAIEGGRWIVTLGGFLGDHAPASEAGFLAYARSLPATEIHEVVSRAQPLSDFVTHGFPASLRRRYEKMARFPEGYLVFGDALASFNPIYGQGMTVAALEALTLIECLGEQAAGMDGLARLFFGRAAKAIDTAWTLAAGADFGYPQVAGRRPGGTDLINWYVGGAHRAAMRDPEVCRAFFEVANLLRPPAHLFTPAIALRIARGCLLPPGGSRPAASVISVQAR